MVHIALSTLVKMSRSSVSSKKFLLDTNVISETRKRHSHHGVIRFLENTSADSTFLSVLTFGELYIGVSNLRRKDPLGAEALGDWIRELEANYATRTLGVDLLTATAWGTLSGDKSRTPIDTLLGATAYVHGMTIVTRNTKDFRELPVVLLNPWEI